MFPVLRFYWEYFLQFLHIRTLLKHSQKWPWTSATQLYRLETKMIIRNEYLLLCIGWFTWIWGTTMGWWEEDIPSYVILLPPRVLVFLLLLIYYVPLFSVYSFISASHFFSPAISLFIPHFPLSFGELLCYLFLSCGLERKQTGTERSSHRTQLHVTLPSSASCFHSPFSPLSSPISLPRFLNVFLYMYTFQSYIWPSTLPSLATSILVFLPFSSLTPTTIWSFFSV